MYYLDLTNGRGEKLCLAFFTQSRQVYAHNRIFRMLDDKQDSDERGLYPLEYVMSLYNEKMTHSIYQGTRSILCE